MNYKQLLILRLSNLTKWKNEKEMIIPKEMRRDFDWFNTCEFLGDGRCILRYYWENGQLHREIEYRNGLRHGKNIYWWKNGDKCWETQYQNGQKHGKSLCWYENGNKEGEAQYQNGKLVRKAK